MRRLWMWFLLLNKRLYKKLTFVVIMLLIPVLVFGYSGMAQEESGIMTIALAQEGDDPLAATIIQDLKDNTNLILFLVCNSPEDAKKMINDGKADAAWIFADNLENRIYRFVNRPSKLTSFIQIIERESTVPMKLVREKLTGTVFRYCSGAFYVNYIRDHVPPMKDVPDDELMRHYDEFITNIDLFEFAYLDGEGGAEDIEDANYLLTPVRGLLAIVIVLGGLAASMFYMHDCRCGTYSLVPQGKKFLVEFACQIIATLNLALVSLLSMFLAGISVGIMRELLLMVLYSVTASLFCMVLRRLLGGISAVGTALPLLIVVMLVICPVFFDLGPLRKFQYIFPPMYYINAVQSNRFMLLMAGYSIILISVYYLIGKMLRKK